MNLKAALLENFLKYFFSLTLFPVLKDLLK